MTEDDSKVPRYFSPTGAWMVSSSEKYPGIALLEFINENEEVVVDMVLTIPQIEELTTSLLASANKHIVHKQ